MSNLLRRTSRVRKAAVVVGFLAAALATAPTAASATAPTAVQPAGASACPAGYLCFWADANFSNAMGKFAGTNDWWGAYSEAACNHSDSNGTWNDCASSIYNHDNYDVMTVWKDLNHTGDHQCLPLGTQWSDLTKHYYNSGGSNMNDSITSNTLGGTSC